MDLGLQGKVALIAAGSKGLGFGVAREMIANGARVSLCSRDSAAVDAAVAQLKESPNAEVIGVACDVRDGAAITNWVDTTVAQWGRIDALLVNAGGPPAAIFKEISEEQWYAAFELTLMSSVRMIRAAIPHMTEGGAILAITSSSVVEPIPRLALSTVMRLGVVGLVKTLADELAEDGIRVNNIIPGRIDTDRVAQLDQNTADKLGISFDEARRRSREKIPFKRLGTTDEFGRAGAFLLSPAASFISGATLRLDGGMIRAIG